MFGRLAIACPIVPRTTHLVARIGSLVSLGGRLLSVVGPQLTREPVSLALVRRLLPRIARGLVGLLIRGRQVDADRMSVVRGRLVEIRRVLVSVGTGLIGLRGRLVCV